MTSCPDRETLRRLLAGDTEAATDITVSNHVQTCSKCLQVLEELTRSVPGKSLLGAAAALATGPFAPPDRAEERPRVPEHEIGEQLGRGGMGVVFQGRHQRLRRDVAVKVLRTDLGSREELHRRFIEEAQVASQLQHPGVPPIHELGTLPDGRPFFTMKLVRGRTLADLLRERRSPADDLPQFLKVFEQVCQAVAYAHSKGVIHRDLKPSNVMVGAFGEVQVMDWGLAKVLDRNETVKEGAAGAVSTGRPQDGETSSGAVMGTYAYMPPEQARGEIHQVDRRSDVFALGAILCEVLSGQPAYTGSRVEMMTQAEQGNVRAALDRLGTCDADADLVDLARTCLQPDPAKRPADAGAVAASVAAYQAAVQERLRAAEVERAAAAARAEEAQATAAAERRARRIGLGLAASVVLLVTVAGLGGVWFLHARSVVLQAEVEQKERENQRQQAVVQGRDHLRSKDWAKAREAATRTHGLLAAGKITPDLAGVGEAFLADVDTLDRLEEARIQRCGMPNCQFNYDKNAPDEVFRKYGIDVLTLPPEDAARRIRESPIAEELVTALDDWCWVLRDVPEDLRAGQLPRLVAISRAADSDPLRNRLRQALLGDKKTLKAAAVEVAGANNPDQLPVLSLVLLANVFARVEEMDRAIDLLQRADRKEARNFWVNLRLAECHHYYNPPKYDLALQYYLVTRAIRPNNSVVINNLGAVCSHRGDYENARAYLEEAIRLTPGDPRSLHHLGIMYHNQGKNAEAMQTYERALKEKPDYLPSLINLGLLCLQMKQVERGQEMLARAGELAKKVVQERHDSPTDQENLGMVLYTLSIVSVARGRPQEGEDQTTQAIELLSKARPRLPDVAKVTESLSLALRQRGRIRHRMRRPDEGLADLDEAAREIQSVRGDRTGGKKLHGEVFLETAQAHVAALQRVCAAAQQDPQKARERLGRHMARALELIEKVFATETFPRGQLLMTVQVSPAWKPLHQEPAFHQLLVRLYAEAFKAEPTLVEDAKLAHRYNAACAALLATAAPEDGAALPEADRARLRKQALTWLQAEATGWAEYAGNSGPQQEVARKMASHALTDTDLAPVRGDEALAKLPPEERPGWQKLWAEVSRVAGSK